MTTIFDLTTSSLSDDQLSLERESPRVIRTASHSPAHRRACGTRSQEAVSRPGLSIALYRPARQVLHLSEHAAYGRIEAARAAHRFPVVLEHLANGALTLTTVCLLAPLLTPENYDALLAAARYKSRREVEQLVAMTRPKPDVPAAVRKLPSPRSQATMDVPTLDVARTRSATVMGAEQDPNLLLPVTDPAPMRPATTAPVVTPLAQERCKNPIHGVTRSARQAAPRASLAPACDSKRGSCRRVREGS